MFCPLVHLKESNRRLKFERELKQVNGEFRRYPVTMHIGKKLYFHMQLPFLMV